MAISNTFLVLSLATFCAADLGGGAAPQAGYGTPDAGYGTPDAGYGTPDAGYGTPDSEYRPTATGYGGGYDTQVGYDYDQQSYEAATGGGDDIFGKIGDLLPLFIAVFAAIILAQLITQPLLNLLGLLIMLIPGKLALKAPILNFLLGIFGLQLCNTAADGTLTAFPGGRGIDGRAFSDAASSFGYDISADKINIIHGFVENALHSFNSENQDLPRF